MNNFKMGGGGFKGKKVWRAKPWWPSLVSMRNATPGSCYAVEEGSASTELYCNEDHASSNIWFFERQILEFRLRKCRVEGRPLVHFFF